MITSGLEDAVFTVSCAASCREHQQFTHMNFCPLWTCLPIVLRLRCEPPAARMRLLTISDIVEHNDNALSAELLLDPIQAVSRPCVFLVVAF
jgi:hypothetical protein